MASSLSPFSLATSAQLSSSPNFVNGRIFSSSCRIVSSLSSFHLSRRLSLLHLGAAAVQPHLVGVKESKLPISERNILDAGTVGNVAQAMPAVIEEDAAEWTKNDKRRLLHVVYRVGDLDKTIKFYTECLGMKILRKRDIPEEKYSNAFLGYGPEESNFAVELTYNYGVDKYDVGTGFGYFGVAVEDVAKTVGLVKAKGGKVTKEPGPVKGENSITAVIEDPNGYKFELLERAPRSEPLCKVMLRVGDLDRAIDFYKKAYGMELLRKMNIPEYKVTTILPSL